MEVAEIKQCHSLTELTGVHRTICGVRSLKMVLRISMTCDGCSNRIEGALKGTAGVLSAEISHAGTAYLLRAAKAIGLLDISSFYRCCLYSQPTSQRPQSKSTPGFGHWWFSYTAGSGVIQYSATDANNFVSVTPTHRPYLRKPCEQEFLIRSLLVFVCSLLEMYRTTLLRNVSLAAK